ncbi:MAG: hypothetical protein Q4E31_12535 [Intestinibacter bartlettii]|uniref:hypothetical protein n=1 Tax=Intestinibacter bartlettii TaxID=261299 RepID=UPI0026EB4EB9|nr:hypothetical protein [Intestinibacter bartlettii]MDO5011645.1 hypothetical protein [Intestinibacter bartlettii]
MKQIHKYAKVAIGITILVLMILIKNNTIILKDKLNEYERLDSNIAEIDVDTEVYYSEHGDKISKYLELESKYGELEQEFIKYKEKYPKDLVNEIENRKDEVDKLYKEAIELEHKLKNTMQSKQESQVANSYSNGSSNYGSSSSGNSYSNGHSHNNTSSNKHIGKRVYVANGNSYYHAISNCSYLEGAPTYIVTLTSDMRKYECNCWTNPVVYKKPSTNYNTGNSNSSGRTVYIASGNSYYHNSPSCKFLRGASARAVGINNVGGKHPCNCVKY